MFYCTANGTQYRKVNSRQVWNTVGKLSFVYGFARFNLCVGCATKKVDTPSLYSYILCDGVIYAMCDIS